MCKKRKDTLAVNPEPRPRTPVISSISGGSAIPSFGESSSEIATDGAREGVRLLSFKPSSSGSSDHLSVASLREALPEKPNLYEFSEIFAATRSPDARRLSSSSSSSWRCSIRGKDVVIVQRRFLGDPSEFRRRVVAATSVHHKNIVRILGAVLGGDDLFLVYEYVNGASLRECLRSPRNPGYTLLATWIERMQVATDIAQGLQYIHHFTTSRTATPLSPHQGSHRCPVHDRIKSSSIMITEIGRRAKICHFGAVELSRATYEFDCDGDGIEKAISGDHSTVFSPKMRRSSSRKVKFEGARGYIAPEIRQGGPASQKSDVYAFGVVLLELLTGEEPVKYTYNRESKGYEMVSQIESARRLMEVEKQGQEHESEPESLGNDLPEAENNRRIRSWVDPRLKDSFPVDVVERVIQVALQCVEPEAEKRPDMVRVAAKLSAFLMQSKTWAEKMGFPEELTVSLAPR